MATMLERNQEATNAIMAANKMMNTTTLGWGTYDKTRLCTIAHISDVHLDTTRYANFIDYVKGVSVIDHAIVSGDLVVNPTASEFASMYAVETAANYSPIKVVGNHERYGSGTYMAIADIYTNLHLNTNTGELYYYIDDTTYNIRFIILNQWDTSYQTYKTEHLSQDQIDWFIATLKGAITNGYAVIVCLHATESNGAYPVYKAPYKSVYGYDGSANNAFYQRFKQWEGESSAQNICDGTPIEDIINAFKHAGSLNHTYTFTDDNTTITVNDSFSTAGEFVAYINGHMHGDYIGCSINYADQMYLNVCAGGASYRNVSDLQRNDSDGKHQDAFNVYVIDTTHKLVKVIRVGADINDLMQDRKYAVYSYA